MGVKFNVADLGRVGLVNPKQVNYRDSIEIIKDESIKVQKSFVKIGWYLKHIRDNGMYREDGFTNIYECAASQLGYSQSTASRLISICEKFSKGHNSPELDEKYAGFDKSQMIEMLPMGAEQIEKVTSDMTVKQIREIKTEKRDESVNLQEDDNIPGQTSIEEDFPMYMPGGGEETQDAPMIETEVYSPNVGVVDGEYREAVEAGTKDNEDIRQAGRNIYFSDNEIEALRDVVREWCEMMGTGEQEACDSVGERLQNGLGSALKKLYEGTNGERVNKDY